MEIKIADCSVTKEILDAADTSQTVALFEIPFDAYVLNVMGRVKTAFAGVTSPKVSVGYSSDTDLFCASTPINTVGDLHRGSFYETNRCARPYDFVKTEAGRQVIATFSSSADNFSSLSAGEVEFVVVYLV